MDYFTTKTPTHSQSLAFKVLAVKEYSRLFVTARGGYHGIVEDLLRRKLHLRKNKALVDLCLAPMKALLVKVKPQVSTSTRCIFKNDPMWIGGYPMGCITSIWAGRAVAPPLLFKLHLYFNQL